MTSKCKFTEPSFNAVLCAVLSIALVGVTFIKCGSGFEFTDEGFYLNWITHPELYPSSVTQFGFVYKPLYEMLDFDLALLRQVNVLITLALAFISIWIAMGMAGLANCPRAAGSLALATAVLIMLHHMWLPTPNYNWLNLQGLLIAVAGLLFFERQRADVDFLVSGLLLGTSLVVVSLAKPPSALGLGLIYLGLLTWEFVIGRRQQALTTASVAAVTGASLGLIAIYAIDGSVLDFVERLRRGVDLGYTLGPNLGHKNRSELEIVRWDRFNPSAEFFWLALLLFTGAASYVIAQTKDTALARYGRMFLLIFLALFAIAALLRPIGIDLSSRGFNAYLLAAVLLGALAGAVLVRDRSSSVRGPRLGLVLFLLPLVHAIGTTNNLWLQMSQAFVFWVMSAAMVFTAVLGPDTRARALTGLSAAVAACSIVLVADSMERPYRQILPLHAQAVPIAVDQRSRHVIQVEPQTAEFIHKLRDAAKEGGIGSLLDVSGRHPAAAFVAGAFAPGTPWLLGGYTGSAEFFVAALAPVSCEVIAGSWLLTAPPGAKQSIPTTVLSSVGIELERDFDLVATLKSPWYKTQLSLWRPKRTESAASSACREARSVRSF